MKIDIQKLDEIVRQAAKEQILPHFNCLKSHEINTKSSPNDLVTIADKKSEKFITSEIVKLYPDAMIIGEEAFFENPKMLDNPAKDKLVFVVDPVDGTRNFKEGKYDFGVILGCVFGGEIIAGIIYLPMYDKMMICEKGSGTFINGKKQQVKEKTTDIMEMSGRVWGVQEHFAKHTKFAEKNSCAAVSHIKFITNEINYIAHMTKPIYPWDYVAGVLAANEAGGYVRQINGGEYYYANTTTNQDLIITDSKRNFEELQKIANILKKD